MALPTCAIAALFLFTPSVSRAQLPLFPDGDAVFPARGQLRLSITTLWERYDSRSGFTGATESENEDLGARFSGTLGTSLFPRFAPLEASIRTAAGLPTFALSLGESVVRADVNRTVTPFSGELGITRSLSIGVAIPLVRVVSEVSVDVNRSASGANVGVNPAIDLLVARNTNVAVRDQLTAAALSLEQSLATCTANPGAAGCSALLARQGEATTLITQARGVRNAIESLFGSDTVDAGLLVPLTGSTAANSIDARLASMNALFRELLALEAAAPDPLVARPFSAQTAITLSQFRTLLENPQRGIGLLPLQRVRRQGTGDIEFSARLRLLDTFSADSSAGAGLRVALGALFRAGTGLAADPSIPFDLGTGDAQNDVEVGGSLYTRLSRALSIGASARLGIQMATTRAVRIAPPGTPFPELFTQRDVDFDPGDYFDFSVHPALRVGRLAEIGAMYSVHTRQSDHYTGTFQVTDAESGRGALTLNASVLDAGTAISVHRFGATLRIRNFTGNTRSHRMPLEFGYGIAGTLSSSGFGVPHSTTQQLMLRIYMHLFGG